MSALPHHLLDLTSANGIERKFPAAGALPFPMPEGTHLGSKHASINGHTTSIVPKWTAMVTVSVPLCLPLANGKGAFAPRLELLYDQRTATWGVSYTSANSHITFFALFALLSL